MNRSDRENSDPMSGEVYAVNNRTLAALCGLYGFGILGAFMLFHAAFRLVICVWGYTMTGLDPGAGRRGICICHNLLHRGGTVLPGL